MDNLVIVKLTPSTFIISPSLIWSKGNDYILWLLARLYEVQGELL